MSTPADDLRAEIAAALADANLRDIGDGLAVRPFAAGSPVALAYADAVLARFPADVTEAHCRNLVLRSEHRQEVSWLSEACRLTVADAAIAREQRGRLHRDATTARAKLIELIGGDWTVEPSLAELAMYVARFWGDDRKELDHLRAEVSRLSGGNTTPKDAAAFRSALAQAIHLPADTEPGVLLAEVRHRFQHAIRSVVGHAYRNGYLACECGLSTPTLGDWSKHQDELLAAGEPPAHLPAESGWGSAVATPDDTPAGEVHPPGARPVTYIHDSRGWTLTCVLCPWTENVATATEAERWAELHEHVCPASPAGDTGDSEREDAEDTTDPKLIAALRHLGDDFGPLGVALVAARLTDPRVLVNHLTYPAGQVQQEPEDHDAVAVVEHRSEFRELPQHPGRWIATCRLGDWVGSGTHDEVEHSADRHYDDALTVTLAAPTAQPEETRTDG